MVGIMEKKKKYHSIIYNNLCLINVRQRVERNEEIVNEIAKELTEPKRTNDNDIITAAKTSQILVA